MSEQDEISRLETIGWENHSLKYLSLTGEELHGLDKIHWRKNSWRRLSLIDDETVINLQRMKVYVFSDSVLCLGKVRAKIGIRNFDITDCEPMEFEWILFPRFNTLQVSEEVKSLLLRLDDTPENFTRRMLFMTMFSDISCGSRESEKECLANTKLVSLFATRFGTRH